MESAVGVMDGVLDKWVDAELIAESSWDRFIVVIIRQYFKSKQAHQFDYRHRMKKRST